MITTDTNMPTPRKPGRPLSFDRQAALHQAATARDAASPMVVFVAHAYLRDHTAWVPVG
jgi:hypothetical protein